LPFHDLHIYVCSHGSCDHRCGNTESAVVEALREALVPRGAWIRARMSSLHSGRKTGSLSPQSIWERIRIGGTAHVGGHDSTSTPFVASRSSSSLAFCDRTMHVLPVHSYGLQSQIQQQLPSLPVQEQYPRDIVTIVASLAVLGLSRVHLDTEPAIVLRSSTSWWSRSVIVNPVDLFAIVLSTDACKLHSIESLQKCTGIPA